MPDEFGDVGLPPRDQLKASVLAIDIENQDDFIFLDQVTRRRSPQAINSLKSAIGLNYIDPIHVKNILEFGAGEGVSTFGLLQVAEVLGAEVEVVEKRKNRVDELLRSNILPEAKIHLTDGITLLDANKDAYDLITAFWFGPDNNADLFRQLAFVGAHALREDGKFLVTSDASTLSAIQSVCRQADVRPNVVQEVRDDDDIKTPTTLVIPKEGLIKINTVFKE